MQDHRLSHIIFLVLLLISCSDLSEDTYYFELHEGDRTGLHTINTLHQDEEFNVFKYMYFYNGGGVAAGDFNNDSLVDLYFTNNMEENCMFLNTGGLQFKDVTQLAGVEGIKGWSTGVSVVDINNDGLLDLYVNQVADYEHLSGTNQLYVCTGVEDGIPTYEDQAADYNLDLIGFGTQAAFFDYDLDGDLDMFQLNHSLHQNGTFGRRDGFASKKHPTAGDKLLRNDGDIFVEVTDSAGIFSNVIGYGLGLAISDINFDGWPDIYVGNDFHENDYLYINQKDGTFKESLDEFITHTSRFSMGVDISDINNDARVDIISLDMLPEDPYILKSSLGEDGYDIYQFKLGYGYGHQFARNNLQVNNGRGGFTELGLYADIYATDWSWAPLFLDVNNDGLQDLFVSNGIPRRMNDIDYINFQMGDEDVRWKTENGEVDNSDLDIINRMPQIKLANPIFLNQGAVRFEEISTNIRHNKTSYSNGAVYADLDNDGDLDIVVSNIEDEPFVYENLHKGHNNYLRIALKGPEENIGAIGARVMVHLQSGDIKYQENFPVRGYQSSTSGPLHMGIPDTTLVDSILIIWPDLSVQHIEPVFNRTIHYSWQPKLPPYPFKVSETHSDSIHFSNVNKESNISFKHEENPFVDFNREPLIPHKVSTEGPALAVGDVNQDGLDDFFVGSSKRRRSGVFFQMGNGQFVESTQFDLQNDTVYEDVDAVFADIENDGDLDLIIATGGNEYRGRQDPLKQRLYVNDGRGNFSRTDVLDSIRMTASCVLEADFNGDGFVDLFFGGRAVPWSYGIIPQSYLLQNRGDGTYENVTGVVSTGLEKVGFVKDGDWFDFDQDGDEDLLLALEWGMITIFVNEKGILKKLEVGDQKGWWNCLLPGDFDGDGDIDILAGNTGKNSRFKPSHEEPVRLYVNDFDNNGQVDPILTYFIDGKEIPFANFKEITKQLVSVKKKYLYARDFAGATLDELFGSENLENSAVFEVNTLEHMFFENQGDNRTYSAVSLPEALQYSTLNALAFIEDESAVQKILAGGNFFDINIEMGRYDGSRGNVLYFDGDSLWSSPVPGVDLSGQIRSIKAIALERNIGFLIAKNNAALEILESNISVSKMEQ